MNLLEIICGILVVVIIFLCAKIILMKKAVKEITDSFTEKLESDTNTFVTVSTSDKAIRNLANNINIQLIELRRQKHRFVQGDMELKNAMTNISHDLRTPLTAISGYLELLEKCEKSETVTQYTEIIKNRTQALIKLTDELFDYLVISSYGYDVKEENTDIKAVLEDSVIGFYAALNEKGIKPEIRLTDKKIVRNLNAVALQRVFSNILNNAVKYSDGDLNIDMTDDGTITFSNYASKLNEVQVEKLFDRFYTVENAGKSTGLGLSIARTLVTQMNGTIYAEYIDGKLYVRIILPKAD